MRNILIVLVVLLVAIVLTAEEKKPKIAVMEVEDTSGVVSAKVLNNATEILRGLLTSSGSFVVIDKSRQREKIQEIVKNEKKESWKECYDQSCRIQLGQSLAADSILRTSISCLGKECYFSSELVDLGKEANIGGGTASFEYNENDMKGLKVALESVVTQIVQLAKTLAVERTERLKQAAEAEQRRQENEAQLRELEKQQKAEQEKALEMELSARTQQQQPAVKQVATEPESAPVQTQPVEEKKVERIRPYLWYGVGTLIGGVALAAGGGAGFWFAAKEKQDLYNEKIRTENIDAAVESGVPRDKYLNDIRNLWDDGQTFGTLGYVCIGVGSAAVVAGIILALWSEEEGLVAGVAPVPGGFMLAAGFEF